MSNYVVTGEQLTDIADAIRSKTGGTDPIVFPDGFVEAISGISATLETNASRGGQKQLANGSYRADQLLFYINRPESEIWDIDTLDVTFGGAPCTANVGQNQISLVSTAPFEVTTQSPKRVTISYKAAYAAVIDKD